MAHEAEIVVKNIRVSPEEVANDGLGRVSVSAMVFTPADGAVISRVFLDVPFLQSGQGVEMAFDEQEGIAATREGRYSCSFEVPLLTDPGDYQLPIVALDSKGTSGTRKVPLSVYYRRPSYSGTILDPVNQRCLDALSSSGVTFGNLVEPLRDGEAAFEKRYSLIEKARRQINIQSYTLSAEGRCGRLVELLLEKSSQGVEVNCLLNMGSQLVVSPMAAIRLGFQRMGKDLQELAREIDDTIGGRQGVQEMIKDVQGIFQRLGKGPHGANVLLVDEQAIVGRDKKAADAGRRSGIWLEKMTRSRSRMSVADQKKLSEWFFSFSGPGGLPGVPMLTYAVHEKILIVDGSMAVVGGRNLEDRYFTHWIDTDVYLEGPVVRRIQEGFLRSWQEFSRNLDREVSITPLLVDSEPAGTTPVRFVQSRPWLGEYTTLENLVTAIQMARERILIASQYIVLPDSLLRDALLEAAQRGVEIHILTNSATTAQEVGFSGGYVLSLTYMEPLLEAGMRIYEVNGPQEEGMPKPYLHAKEFIIDGLWAAIGSFNLSIRSCYIESENLLNIQDEVFAQAQEENFWDRVRKDTTEITKEYLALQKERFRAKMAIARYLDLFY